ncbi:ABC transporter substrate-binding protein [Clostridium sp. BL-8]|uniref:ABC transporter substrate-binding protein n=1 Tax=Clostridium sp. BL-8 TaxID=349938 RepID=UPI00098C5C5D|nr:ABC transporter substrate-binding protein [Clostridium sp. BL-8]OOM76171.1 arginine-binding extracellular protein ArtP precursor [Clostridium sp. BL-8]
MKKGIIKKIAAVLAVSTIAISMIGCGSTSSTKKDGAASSTSSLDAIKAKGKLVIGTSADFPPYEFHTNKDGKDEIVGIDIDIAKEVAKDLGVELEVKDMDFDGLLVALQANKVDMVFSGMTPKPERKENADFSDIYYEVTQTYITRKADADKIKSEDDLKNLRIGVQKSSVQEDLAKDKFDAANIKSLTKVTDLMLDLKNNKVDAVLLESPIAEFNAKKNDDLAVSSINFKDDEGGYAIAMPKNSPELVSSVNKTIQRLKDEKKIDDFAANAASLVE